MIANDDELRVTLDRVARFQEQVAQLRRLETDPANYHASVSGFLAEIDRMQLDVREYLATHTGGPSRCCRGQARRVAGDQEREMHHLRGDLAATTDLSFKGLS